ncbi:hypothetical protein V2J09_010771, partial [Rumex salicifolius]
KRNLGVSLEVVHRHGPCTKIKSTSTGNALDHLEIFQLDQERVDSIHSRLSTLEPLAEDKAVPKKKSATLTSKLHRSDLTWTQCKSCAVSCYRQVDPTFEPAASTTYSNVSCTSATCMELVGQSSAIPKCTRSTGTCVYGVEYGDSSFSAGLLAKERHYQTGGIKEEAGQMWEKTHTSVSHSHPRTTSTASSSGAGRATRACSGTPPASSDSVGISFPLFLRPLPSTATTSPIACHFTLPPPDTSLSAKAARYTPLVKSSKSTPFYLVALESISVGGIRLSISPKVFSSAKTLIDSGTVITRLPPQAYSALSVTFKKLMSKYTSAPALSILDTCFDLSAYQTVSVPKVVLAFHGGAALDLPLSGTLFASKTSQVCLAFAGNSMDTSPPIIGNIQQKSFDVVYDVDGGKIGFGPNAC